MKLNYISTPTLELEGTKSNLHNSKCIYNLAERGHQLSSAHAQEAYLKIKTMDRDILELRLSRPHLGSVKISAAKWHLDAQVQNEPDHSETLSEKTLLFIDANPMSLYPSPPSTAPSSYRTKPPAHDIVHSK